MKIVKSFKELTSIREELPGPVGFVPTMGYLHAGHVSLVRTARAKNESVIVSIFVNPTQFAPAEDLRSYPRDLARDAELLEGAGVDLIWTPDEETMYPQGYQTWVSVEEVTRELEGARRPGHFRGVATVVAKLFNAVRPDRAYFGQKDAQQVVVIRQMVRDLNYPVAIEVCPIVREADGLALSSRNSYLNPAERQAATVLSRALNTAEQAFERGEDDSGVLREVLLGVLNQEPLARVQYVSVAHPQTLKELEGKADQALISLAVYVGKTRLIDNVLVG